MKNCAAYCDILLSLCNKLNQIIVICIFINSFTIGLFIFFLVVKLLNSAHKRIISRTYFCKSFWRWESETWKIFQDNPWHQSMSQTDKINLTINISFLCQFQYSECTRLVRIIQWIYSVTAIEGIELRKKNTKNIRRKRFLK